MANNFYFSALPIEKVTKNNILIVTPSTIQKHYTILGWHTSLGYTIRCQPNGQPYKLP